MRIQRRRGGNDGRNKSALNKMNWGGGREEGREGKKKKERTDGDGHDILGPYWVLGSNAVSPIGKVFYFILLLKKDCNPPPPSSYCSKKQKKRGGCNSPHPPLPVEAGCLPPGRTSFPPAVTSARVSRARRQVPGRLRRQPAAAGERAALLLRRLPSLPCGGRAASPSPRPRRSSPPPAEARRRSRPARSGGHRPPVRPPAPPGRLSHCGALLSARRATAA